MGRSGKKKKAVLSATVPIIHAASLGSQGGVIKGAELTKDEAIECRKRGEDVVDCGPSSKDNRYLAQGIEGQAIGDMAEVERHFPHAKAGPKSLPHCQPSDRPPEGHTFYETEKRKASHA
jgi:hypothetical protein